LRGGRNAGANNTNSKSEAQHPGEGPIHRVSEL